MANGQITFDDLEQLVPGHKKEYTELDMLIILRDKQRLSKMSEQERLTFLSFLFIKMSESEEFKNKALDAAAKK